jgi:GNAT superfamily N-acetyltransferase
LFRKYLLFRADGYGNPPTDNQAGADKGGPQLISMISIRKYNQDDAQAVGILVADTYSEYNLSFAVPRELEKLLGPFWFARSEEPEHQKAIEVVIEAKMVFVADDEGEVVGVLRGRKERLQSLFVRADHHRTGIGSQLVERFEDECRRQGSRQIKVAATLYAVPFYSRIGYKKTTGLRPGWSFGGSGLVYQPMKKVLVRG